MKTIWGFDLGVTSIGGSIIKWDENAPGGPAGEVVWTGVRIFPEATEPKTTKPKNLARRTARLMRRTLRRRRWRRAHFRELLTQSGLIPDSKALPPGGQDPYELRAKGLKEALTAEELGWALFHLLKRRGFQGSRKFADQPSDTKKDEDEEKQKKRESTLKQFLNGRYLSEGLVTILDQNTPEAPSNADGDVSPVDGEQSSRPTRRRACGQTREMVKDELEALLLTQRQYHPNILTDEFQRAMERITLFQRPTFFRVRTFGLCSLEAEEIVALKADWATQKFETLQLVNGLRLDGGNNRPLDADERGRAIGYLNQVPKPTFAGLRKAIGLAKGEKFTHEKGKKETVRGNATEAALRAALGDDYGALPAAAAIRQHIGQAWHTIEYNPARGGTILEIRDAAGIKAARQRLMERSVAEWGLSEDQAEKLSQIDLPHGNSRHSLKAIKRLLPHLEAGAPYMSAVQAEYAPTDSAAAPVRFLPGPNMSELGSIKDPYVRAEMIRILSGIRNPTVIRLLNELQKVVNTLIRVYGKPDLIRVEFARDLKVSGKERAEIDKRQAENEKARKTAEAALIKQGFQPSYSAVERYLLHEEQGGRCPYSGEFFSLTQALDATATEVDHIFPRSRSFEDGRGNKVLCFLSTNRQKRNQTPYEYLSRDPALLNDRTQNVWPQMVKTGWSQSKARRCARQDYGSAADDGFSDRQLVDTAYLARASRDYLGLLFGGGKAGKMCVQPISSRATTMIRRSLGLGLSKLLHDDDEAGAKSRDDHRHHAVDALATAISTPRMIQQISRWWQAREFGVPRPVIPPPWPTFRAEARASISQLLVSHKVSAKLTNRMHEATTIAKTEIVENGSSKYVKRIPITGIKHSDIDKIRDIGVRRVFEQLLKDCGSDATKFTEALKVGLRLPTKDGRPGPVIEKVRILFPLKSSVMPIRQSVNSWAENGKGTNDHIAIYRYGNKFRYSTVTKLASLQQSRAGRPVVSVEHEDGGNLVFSLRSGDVIRRDDILGVSYLVVVSFAAVGKITLRSIYDSTNAEEAETRLNPKPMLTKGWKKVSIDAIGRVIG